MMVSPRCFEPEACKRSSEKLTRSHRGAADEALLGTGSVVQSRLSRILPHRGRPDPNSAVQAKACSPAMSSKSAPSRAALDACTWCFGS
jgi:hypothetical protein